MLEARAEILSEVFGVCNGSRRACLGAWEPRAAMRWIYQCLFFDYLAAGMRGRWVDRLARSALSYSAGGVGQGLSARAAEAEH